MLTPVLGSRSIADPDSVVLTIFRASYDTLYTGNPGLIVVDDAALLSRERLLIELCGFHHAGTGCDQRAVSASPKRMSARTDINYPTGESGYGRGAYTLEYDMERQAYGTNSWEPVRRPGRVETVLSVHVDGTDSPAVQVPVTRGSNRLMLERREFFRELRYDIQSHILDTDSALVLIDLEARLGQELEHVRRDSVLVRSKSILERREELTRLVEDAGEQVLDRMMGRFGSARAYVFINDWTYEALDRTYVATMELHWQDGRRRNWSDITAQLSIRFDGTRGHMTLIRSSELALERWERAFGSTQTILEPLYRETPPS